MIYREFADHIGVCRDCDGVYLCADALRLRALLIVAAPQTLDEWQSAIDALNDEKGWNVQRSEPEWAALAHSEVTEAFEAWRGHKPDVYFDAPDGKPEGAAIEYADVLYRVLHWFARHGLNAQHALAMKYEYNKTRPFRHGGKRA